MRIPTPLRRLAGEERVVRVPGATVREVLDALVRRYPGLRARLREESGALRSSVLVFVNAEDIRSTGGEQAAVCEGDTVSIVTVADGG